MYPLLQTSSVQIRYQKCKRAVYHLMLSIHPAYPVSVEKEQSEGLGEGEVKNTGPSYEEKRARLHIQYVLVLTEGVDVLIVRHVSKSIASIKGS